MSGKYEIKKAKGGKVFFNLKAGNGQIILTSQMYKNKAGAKNGIKSVQKNCDNAALYEIKTGAKKKGYFVLLAKNKQVIGKSQSYASPASLNNGIASVKKNGPSTVINDLTA